MTTDAFVIDSVPVGARRALAISSLTDAGVLYGVFHFLRHLQTGQPLDAIDAASGPRIGLRMLDHWDNLDGSIERGYAGRSLWRWDELPDTVSPRMRDYARANASIGINAVALNNVNASAQILTPAYLRKVAALADVFRPWGIRVFLSARWSAPIELGGAATADPRDAAVAAWWRAKVDEIYALIPDFGGFLVKANSEGQPGPQDYGRTHADGANMLADALAPHKGVVIWRAFVYKADVAEDRAKQAYAELVPLDGTFRPNVKLQVKNGPIDFQPREPFHPLFGAMPRTQMMLELQITQEYLGQGTHLAYLAPLFKEMLDADTYADGPEIDRRPHRRRQRDGGRRGPPVLRHRRRRQHRRRPQLVRPPVRAGELVRVRPARLGPWPRRRRHRRRMDAHDVHVRRPLRRAGQGDDAGVARGGRRLHDAAGPAPHHGRGAPPRPRPLGRRRRTPAAPTGRRSTTTAPTRTASASIARRAAATPSSLYRSPLRDQFADLATCPENLLLWFHHVAWDHRCRSGRTLWDELCHRYSARRRRRPPHAGDLGRRWPRSSIARATAHVRRLLAIQEQEARWWRNACLLYFQTFSRRPLPDGLEPLEGTLEEYRQSLTVRAWRCRRTSSPSARAAWR